MLVVWLENEHIEFWNPEISASLDLKTTFQPLDMQLCAMNSNNQEQKAALTIFTFLVIIPYRNSPDYIKGDLFSTAMQQFGVLNLWQCGDITLNVES